MLIQIIDNIIKFFVCKILRIDLSDDMCYKIMQFVKFGFVGLSNVIVSYVIYVIVLLLFQRFNLFVDTDYIIAQIVGYVISIFWSFYLNNKYVFKSELKTSWIAALIKSFVHIVQSDFSSDCLKFFMQAVACAKNFGQYGGKYANKMCK